ncbi:hypothetical protein [Corynebacterium tapiri]|uniref:Uncharacterized protein n=1 Tax=Corynebacterium tapiri TaxID=1448266 RepID=A0A5C4U742_9CORY|nr:hypothetical protein [Corynebacterium tapiri]TNL99714.1 hypothetical protein FHE74_01345 [Corynebacterium tapiri]
MSKPLYQDIVLDDAAVARVREYIASSGFEFNGYREFEINRRARYLGWIVQAEDLEAFGVGLRAGGEGTFIRMSREQLLGEPSAKVLPLNNPVKARDTLTLSRFYPATIKTGVDTYAGDEGLPGADMDLDLLEAQLHDIADFHRGEPTYGNQEILDLKIYWGTLLAGRYPRLKALASRMSEKQLTRLEHFETEVRESEPILKELGLPTLETLKTIPTRNG